MNDEKIIDQDGFILVKRKENNTRNHVATYETTNGAAQRKSDMIVSWSLP
jgi:hypothetical protein